MFWRNRKPRWLVDPLDVSLGSVIENGNRNLSRSHVRVKYHREAKALFLPLGIFMRRCQDFVRSGRSLDIEHLLVAPIIKQRYAKFFDLLTDWGPAASRAYRPVLAQRRPESRDS
jgi:hypothetical protein